MTILIIGGSGKTPSRVASSLHAKNIPVLLTSRKGQAGIPAPFKGVVFDWKDNKTFVNPFEADSNIDRVYFVLPPADIFAPTHFSIVKEFIDFAREKGVKRFVTISAALIERGANSAFIHGIVHDYLATSGVEYCVLRPSTFFENFVVFFAPLIRGMDFFPSASENGKIGLVSADDIADAAVDALTEEPGPKTERIIFGPDLLSFDEVAEIFTEVLGRRITHQKITVEQKIEQIKMAGQSDEFARTYAQGDVLLAAGVEKKLYKDEKVVKVIGKRHFKDFVEANKAIWIKND